MSIFLLLAVSYLPATVVAQPRQPPPPGSLAPMRRSIRLGKDRGVTAFLKPIEVTDRRFNPFIVQIKLSSESNLGLRRVRFETSFGDFESEVPLAELPTLSGPAFGDTPRPSVDSTLTLTRIEERSFNIETEQAVWLARTETLVVNVFGRLRKRRYKVGKKALARLQEWLESRIVKHRE